MNMQQVRPNDVVMSYDNWKEIQSVLSDLRKLTVKYWDFAEQDYTLPSFDARQYKSDLKKVKLEIADYVLKTLTD